MSEICTIKWVAASKREQASMIKNIMLSASICYKQAFSLPGAPEVCYVLGEKDNDSVS